MAKLRDSFRYAFEGLWYAVVTQRNMRIHLLATIGVGVYAWLAQTPREKLPLLIFAISLVWITELCNTAIETAVDLYTKEFHPLAKVAKNVAAAAVLVAAVNAVIIGVLVLLF